MRELILKMSISIDGFVGGADGGVKWIFDTYDDKAAEWTVRVISEASLHIMGSRTFHDMAAYWPRSTKDVRTADEPDPQGSLLKARGINPPWGEHDSGAEGRPRPRSAVTTWPPPARVRQLGASLRRNRGSDGGNRETQVPGRQAHHCPRRSRFCMQSRCPGPDRPICPAGPSGGTWQGTATVRRPARAKVSQALEFHDLSARHCRADLFTAHGARS